MPDNETPTRLSVSSDALLPVFAASAMVLWVAAEFALRRGAASLLAGPLGSGLGADMASVAVGFPLLAAAIAWVGIRVGIAPEEWGYSASLRAIGVGLAGVVVYFFLYLAAVLVLVVLLGVQPAVTPSALGVSGAPMWAAVLLFLVNGVVVPITEELVWRGVIQTALMESYGTRVALVVTALAFVSKHLLVDLAAPLFRVLSLVVLAFVLCGLRARYGTTSSTVTHLVVNGVATVVLVLG